MIFRRPDATLFVPDGLPEAEALARVTHLGIGAHQDDLEFMAIHGIAACYGSATRWFGGVTCTDGAGSARSGAYAALDDRAMRELRRREQHLAASVGQYGVMVQLGHPSATVQDPDDPSLHTDLAGLLQHIKPRFVYTHNLADKHATHVAVAVAAVRALRLLPPEARPEAVYGCEVWRSLDWMLDADKVAQDVSRAGDLAAALHEVFDSQTAGGKRYDTAVLGRRLANATFLDPRTVDQAQSLALAMDLTPLVRDATLDLAAYVNGFIERFRADVQGRLRACLHGAK